jgi:hypothetical protein
VDGQIDFTAEVDDLVDLGRRPQVMQDDVRRLQWHARPTRRRDMP